ncbi:MAG: hypothetical protein GWP59_03515 [Chlamydiales bacterium]|nr:hypothetical protein [Chlamydiales bacterium]
MNHKQKNTTLTLFWLSFACSLLFIIGGLYFTLSPFISNTYEKVSSKDPQKLYSRFTLDSLDDLFCNSIAQSEKGRLFIFSMSEKKVWETSLNTLKNKDFKILYDKKYGQKLSSHKLSNTSPYPKSYMMHCKLLSYNDEVCLIGSANLTPSSLKKDHNLVMALYNPSFSKWLYNHFEDPSQNHYIDEQLEFYITPKNPLAIARLKELIALAKNSIEVAMYTFTHTELAQELAKAKQRGVKVSVIVEKKQLRSYSQGVVNTFKQANVSLLSLYSQEIMHHKFMLIDKELLCFGSCNWTQGAFTKNKDAFAVIKLSQDNQKKIALIWRRLKLLSKEEV